MILFSTGIFPVYQDQMHAIYKLRRRGTSAYQINSSRNREVERSVFSFFGVKSSANRLPIKGNGKME